MANEKHARLFYLMRALDSLSMLIRVAASCSTEECNALADELEPPVRDLAAKIEARLPELVFPVSTDPRDRVDELIEFEMRDLRVNLARVDKVKLAFGAKR